MITIENTRAHDIGINLPQEFLNVPMAKQDPEDRNKIINGSVQADEDFIRRAMEAHQVVRYYFDEGWLKVVIEADDDDVDDAPQQPSSRRRTKVG